MVMLPSVSSISGGFKSKLEWLTKFIDSHIQTLRGLVVLLAITTFHEVEAASAEIIYGVLKNSVELLEYETTTSSRLGLHAGS